MFTLSTQGFHYAGAIPNVVKDSVDKGIWAVSTAVPLDPNPFKTSKRAKDYLKEYAVTFLVDEGSGQQFKCTICQGVYACQDASKVVQHLKSMHRDK
jgi:hypothetical protein